LALLTPTALAPVALVLSLPEGVLRVPLDFIELPVSFEDPAAGTCGFTAGGEALLTVAVGLLACFAVDATAGATGFLFAVVTASADFLLPNGADAGFLDAEPDVIDDALAAAFGAGLATTAWTLPRFAVLTTLAIARVADFMILRTEDFLLSEDESAILPFSPDLAADFCAACLETGFCARVAVGTDFELAFLDCAGGAALMTFLTAFAAALDRVLTTVFAVAFGSVALLLAAPFGLATGLAGATFGWALMDLAITLPAEDLPFTAAAMTTPALRAGATAVVDFALAGTLAETLLDREGAGMAGDEPTFFLTEATVLTLDLIDFTEVFDFAATLRPSLLDCLSHGGRVL